MEEKVLKVDYSNSAVKSLMVLANIFIGVGILTIGAGLILIATGNLEFGYAFFGILLAGLVFIATSYALLALANISKTASIVRAKIEQE